VLKQYVLNTSILELKMKLVADTFGNFIKFYYVSLPQVNQTDLSAATESALCKNAFDIVMAAQRDKMSRLLSDKIAVGNKDQLFNDLLTMIEKKRLQWKPSEVDGGTAFNALKSLCDAVWYVDGHYHTFADSIFQIACQILLATTSKKNQNTRNNYPPPCVQVHENPIHSNCLEIYGSLLGKRRMEDT